MNGRFVSVILIAGCLSLRAFGFGFSPEAVSVRQAVTNGVEVRWFETWMPAEDGVRLYTYGTAPKEGVRCPIVVQRNPYVPESRVDGAAWALSRTAALRGELPSGPDQVDDARPAQDRVL